MKYDFDKIIDRSWSGDLKHEVLKARYGRDDLIALWVADMDFETPSFVLDAVKIVSLGSVGHKEQYRNDAAHRENQHWDSRHFASSFRRNNKSSFQSFRVETRILL